MPKRLTDTHAFAGRDGLPTVVHAGNLYADDHPLVRLHPEWFRDVSEDRVIGVEQATAAPGERRRR